MHASEGVKSTMAEFEAEIHFAQMFPRATILHFGDDVLFGKQVALECTASIA